MRVLLDCRMATWSGVGRYTTGLARALAVREDVELTQVCVRGDTAPADARVLVATGPPFSFRGAMELARLAHRAHVDVVHCPHFPTPLPARAPLVVTLHDLIPLLFPGVMPSWAKRSVYRAGNARATHVADCIVVPSAATAADVRGLYPRAQEKLRVIPEAADDFSAGPRDELHGDLARRASFPYLLSMGSTRTHKDLGALIRAFANLDSTTGPAGAPDNLSLLLVGSEPRGYLEDALREAPPEVRSRVAFTGPVSDGELRTLYAGATAFVLPSLYEGFGLPVLEAMALGAPVVCSEAGSLPEVAGEAALRFPAGNTAALTERLRRVLEQPELRRDLSKRGQEWAAGFTWEKTAAATVAVYEEADVSDRTSRRW